MGLITKIEQQKNKNRVNIFIDGSFFCGLEKETAVIYRLKEGKIVDENLLSEAITKSEEKRAFEKSIDYISDRLHSKKEIKDKLLKKGFTINVIESVIYKLEEYHYIDDDLFAKNFIEQNTKYSKAVLTGKLIQKGIEKDLIDKNLANLSDTSEFDNCLTIAEKLLKSTKILSLNDKQKFYAKLARRGFRHDTITKVFDTLNIKNVFD